MTAPHCACLSGLTDIQHRLLKAQAHLEAAELALWDLQQVATLGAPGLSKEIGDHRARVGLAAGFCVNHGWKRGAQ